MSKLLAFIVVWHLVNFPVFEQNTTLGGKVIIGGTAAVGGGAAVTSKTWTLVQHPFVNGICPGATTTCTVTLTQNTGSGNLVIGWALPIQSGVTVTNLTAGLGTNVHPAGCAGSDTTAGSSDLRYVLSSTSGVGSVVVTISSNSAGGGWTAGVLEYSWTGGGPAAFDICANRDQSAAAANIAGVSPGTLSGTDDVIFQFGSFSGTASGCPNSSANPADFPGGDATCGLINSSNNAAGTYTNTSSRAALTAVAFK